MSLPQKNTRLTVARTHFEKHIQITKIHVSGKFVELVLNLNELGYADWKNCKVGKVIVPVTIRNEDVYHSVSATD
jgi:hypothetical protein